MLEGFPKIDLSTVISMERSRQERVLCFEIDFENFTIKPEPKKK